MEEWVISTKYVWIGLEEGKIPIIMYNLEMFMTTRKIRRVNNASKIFTSSVEEGDISNTISYVKLFMITMKMKLISAMNTSMKCEKAGMEVGITPLKFLRDGWRKKPYMKRKILFETAHS